MTSGLTTNGLMNSPAGEDPAIQSRLSTAAAVETAASDPRVYLNADPATDRNADDPNADSWRVELAARLKRYRTRRKPRSPRYPSLLLPFEPPESWSRPAPPTGPTGTASAAVAAAPLRTGQDFAFQTNEEPAALTARSLAEARPTPVPQTSQHGPYPYPDQVPEPSAKVIEFPRSAAIPVFRPSDLADPVFDRDRPRIVEVPETLPPPPALGGMLMEPAPPETPDKRADAPAAVPSASIAQRAAAALVDGAILTTALTPFTAIFLRLDSSLIQTLIPSLNRSLISIHGPLPLLAGTLVGIAVLLWAVYEFLFVVYTGSTPGLRAAHLRLAAFDGSPLNRRSRRWRVLASFLSAFSAGLGYLWCILDHDKLCWHDRITHTHVQSAEPAG